MWIILRTMEWRTREIITTDISGSDTDKWSASETATPLDDLIEIKREFAKKTGYSLARFSIE